MNEIIKEIFTMILDYGSTRLEGDKMNILFRYVPGFNAVQCQFYVPGNEPKDKKPDYSVHIQLDAPNAIDELNGLWEYVSKATSI